MHTAVVASLLVFVVFLAVAGRVELFRSPSWELIVQLTGWLVIVVGGRLGTRRWLAPMLIALGGVLNYAAESMSRLLAHGRGDANVILVVLLSPIVGFAGVALMAAGCFLMVRGLIRRLGQPPI